MERIILSVIGRLQWEQQGRVAYIKKNNINLDSFNRKCDLIVIEQLKYKHKAVM